MYEEDFSEGEMNPDSFYVQLSGFASQAKEPTFLLSYPLLGCAIWKGFFYHSSSQSVCFSFVNALLTF